MSVISRMIDEDKKHKYNENEKCPICGKKFDRRGKKKGGKK